MVDMVVINSSEETAGIMAEVLEDEGWSTTTAYTVDFKRGRFDLEAFLTTHDPRVIVWDISIPYEENWAYYQAVKNLPCTQGRQFLITSTNVGALAKLTGDSTTTELLDNSGDNRGPLEILGKPFDLEQLTAAAHRAWQATASGAPSGGS